ncbi:MAG: hypothetical protein J6V50_03405 [Clostridia bacterium]|nr:hypothetical protein [Clostridia bacterium]
METINLKGKDYVTVNERLKEFRRNFKDYALVSKIIELTPEVCTIQAEIIDDKGIVRATGLAQEWKQASFVNKTSYVENCETSAWGRALGNFGIGIDSAICTADELLMALNAQKDGEDKQKPAPAKTTRSDFEKSATAEKKALNAAVKADNPDAVKPSPLPLSEQADKLIEWLDSLTAEQYKAKADSAKDKAHDVRDALLSSNLPELTAKGVQIADRLKAFEAEFELDDKIVF